MAVIELIIPNAKVADFRLGFLKEHPVPFTFVLDGEGNPTTEKLYTYTDLKWFKKVIAGYAIREYKQGKKKLAYEALAIDENIIE